MAQLSGIAQPEIPFVWPDESCSTMGIGVQPLDDGFVYLSKNEPELKSWLELVEVFRLGRIREVVLAVQTMENQYASRNAKRRAILVGYSSHIRRRSSRAL